MQTDQTDVNLHYLRDRGVVVVRGRQEHAESAAALLLSKLHGGGELDENGVREVDRERDRERDGER